MSYTFDHLLNPQQTEPGIGEFALIAPLSWFAANGLKKPGTGAGVGDEVVISENHVFLTNRGFVKFQLAPEKNQYNAETVGDKGFTKFRNAVELFVPGSYEEVHEAVKKLKNEPLCVLVKDSNCEVEMYYQVGDACLGAWLTANFQTGTSAEGVKGYVVTISNHAKSVVLYAGTITMNKPYLPAPESLTISAITTTTLTATWAAVAGATTYVLQRDTDPNFGNPVQVYAGALLTANDVALGPGRLYYYRVFAQAAIFNDGYPAASMAAMKLPAPTGLASSAITDDGFNINFSSLVRSGSFEVQVSDDNTFATIDATSTVSWPSSGTAIADLLPATEYYYRVRAIKAGFPTSDWTTGPASVTTLP